MGQCDCSPQQLGWVLGELIHDVRIFGESQRSRLRYRTSKLADLCTRRSNAQSCFEVLYLCYRVSAVGSNEVYSCLEGMILMLLLLANIPGLRQHN